MSHTDVPLIQRTVVSTNAWIDDVARAFGGCERAHAFQALRAFLHALRDRLTVNEAAQLAAQLPTLLRGVFYENWVPSKTPHPYHDAEAFLSGIAKEANLNGPSEASYAVAAVYPVLCARISGGEIGDVLAVLPGPVHQLLDDIASRA